LQIVRLRTLPFLARLCCELLSGPAKGGKIVKSKKSLRVWLRFNPELAQKFIETRASVGRRTGCDGSLTLSQVSFLVIRFGMLVGDPLIIAAWPRLRCDRGMPNLKTIAEREPAIALLLIDVINDLSFAGSERLLEQALPMAERLSQLKCRAKQYQIPCIYVNDNFGHWKSDFRRIVEQCTVETAPGAAVSRSLLPEEDDYFVLKPKHSGFHATALDTLLDYLAVDTLILTGIAANICVLFTANDAHMRDYGLIVPIDCVASESHRETVWAIAQMGNVMKADTRESDQIELTTYRKPQNKRGSAHRVV
jgi:nicotinamidase-related amidase